jgi:hypothetical protein
MDESVMIEYRTPDLLDVVYTAGLFDGEGSVSISTNGRRLTQQGLPRSSPLLMIQLTSTDEGLIDWLKATWGFKRPG